MSAAALNFLYFHLNPPATIACVLIQDGQPVKAWGDACNAPGVEDLKLRLKSSYEPQQKTQ
ncbi:MAG TPA: hypothetical protein V6D18_00305 [Thermosynechococcaceae cyanobacterium]